MDAATIDLCEYYMRISTGNARLYVLENNTMSKDDRICANIFC